MTTREKTSTTGDVAEVYRACPVARGQSNDIRVLEILPPMSSDDHDTIACRMRIVAGDSKTDYIAVSYVWGNPNIVRLILLDGILMPIRLNIWNFLFQMRDEGHHGYLWIDAICIHQEDVLERSHQVGLMGQIYAAAKMVLVWLGTDDDEEDVAQAVHLLSAQHVSVGEMADWTQSQWKVMQSLFSNEYWSRLWIVQEFTLARAIEVRCGRRTLGEFTLSAFEMFLRRSVWDGMTLDSLSGKPVRLRDMRSMNVSTAMWLIRQQRRVRAGYEVRDDAYLIEMICRYSNANCSDARDHVYGLLALADSSTSISPDYSKSASEIFRDVFNLLKTMYDVSRHKIRIVEPLRTIGSALGLTANDQTVKSIFEEIGAECFLDDDDNGESSS